MARLFFCNEHVAASNATRSSTSARIAINALSTLAPGATAIAAPSAANKRAANSGGAPISGTSKARKDCSIIVTGSATTATGVGIQHRFA